MKLCVTSTGASLDSELDPRFGRSYHFILVDSETLEFQSFENESLGASGGTGVQSGKFVADSGAKIVLTGNVGPKAFSTLGAAGISVITGLAELTVRDSITAYHTGNHRTVTGPTASEHAGMRR